MEKDTINRMRGIRIFLFSQRYDASIGTISASITIASPFNWLDLFDFEFAYIAIDLRSRSYYYFHLISLYIRIRSSSIMSTSEALKAAVTAMTSGASFDVTIICTTDDYQAEYWMGKLGKEPGTGSKFPMVLAVSEDWGGSGAGNGLGTLYAYQKACKLAKDKFDTDLADLLAKSEVSASLYHTAGKGTRMAPLPASENNNKPGVVSSASNVNNSFHMFFPR